MIRNLQESDTGRVAGIWLDTNIKAHSFISPSYWEDHFKEVKEMLLQAEVYVYENGEKEVAGFVGLEDDYIAGIFVWSEAQSRGIGKQLLDFVKGIKKQLSLHVYQKNARAIRFYQREGFHIQNENVERDTGEKEYRMVWENS
ncbi:MAG: GNAT family N-acetyltransferase [Provencibacterium sp.]|jgi:putative acetyltransferase|nr:GNAT family N-acetyltransferase [Provencibacterium sp.]